MPLGTRPRWANSLFALASRRHNEGRSQDAEAILLGTLPSRAQALNDIDLRTCMDASDPRYFSCPASLPENWLLLGDIILERAKGADDVAAAEDAYRRSAEIDFSVRDSGLLAGRWVNVGATNDRLSLAPAD